MSETFFPINDLLRRKLQTGLTIISITACVAATLFLLIFSDQVGFGLTSIAQDTLTLGIAAVLSQFNLFISILIFAVGGVIVAFIVFLLMTQRTKDFGLMKATGCPNSLVFGYFFTELLSVTFVGCTLGSIIGLAIDYIIINFGAFQVYNKAPNLWFIPLVYVAFFIFALIFGAKPIFDAAKMSPHKALSSVQYFKLDKPAQLKPLDKKGLLIRIASRSLFRRKTATLRIVLFLSVVFTLLTVSIAGGIIANDTSSSWIEQSIGKNMLLIADQEMAAQYLDLLSSFSGTTVNQDFDYSRFDFAITNSTIMDLAKISGVLNVDPRLIWYSDVQEVSGYTIDPDTLATIKVGDSRQGTSIIIGVNPHTIANIPYTTGNFLNSSSDSYAVVGDSISQSLYRPYSNFLITGKETIIGDPLLQSIKIQNNTLEISGISLDPLNNGNVTYTSLNRLQNITNINYSNIVLVKVDEHSYDETISQIQSTLVGSNSNLSLVELNGMLQNNIAFLNSIWSTMMFLPIFALSSAVLCLINFHLITIEEQRQEFAILRATGGKPRNILSIMAIQSLTILLSSFAVGISIGTIITILILTANPVISASTVLLISGWLIAAVAAMFLLSLYPAVKFSRKTLIEIIS
jgi:ABC-type antimicrobial peptide transport system permease subunit